MIATTENPRDGKNVPAGPDTRTWWAYLGPFGVFVLLLTLPGLIGKVTAGSTPPLWIARPEFWVYPLQTGVCAALLFSSAGGIRSKTAGPARWPSVR